MSRRKQGATVPAAPAPATARPGWFTRRRVFVALGVVGFALVGWGAWSVLRPDPLRAVHAALDRRDFNAANELLTKYVADHPDDQPTRLLAARTARRAGDFARASEHLAAYAKKGSDEAHALETALLSAQRGNKTEAARLFAEYSARPDSPDAPFVMEAHLETELQRLAPTPETTLDPETGDRAAVGRLHAAADLWLRARLGTADQVQGQVWKGRIYRYAREFAKSATAFREALARDPDNVPARFALALLLAHDAPVEALKHLERLHQLRPDDKRFRYALATAHRSLGHAAEARRVLNEMLEADPNDLSALVELGLLNLDEGKLADAEPLLRKAHEQAPNIPETNVAMVRYMQLAGKPGEAAKYQKRFDELEAQRLNATAPKH